MKFCIDNADTTTIRRFFDIYPIDGVSTNPSILAKAGRAPYEVLREIRSIIGEDGELFVQAVAADADGMVADAHRIVKELGDTTIVKLPSVPEGFKAMKALHVEGVRLCGSGRHRGPREERRHRRRARCLHGRLREPRRQGCHDGYLLDGGTARRKKLTATLRI